MAIAFEAGATGQGLGSSVTFALTVSGSSTALVVAGRTTNTLPTCTYNGVSMTQQTTVTYHSGAVRLTQFGLKNPSSGTNNVVMTTGSAQETVVAANCFSGVDQTTTFRTASSTSDDAFTPGTLSGIASDVGDVVVDFWSWYTNPAATPSPGAGQTQRAMADNGSSFGSMGSSTKAGANPTVTMDWTFTTSSENAHSAVSMIPDAGGGGGPTGPPPGTLLMMGAGT